MNRSDFLKFTLLAPAAATFGFKRPLPVLYGDGIHDDAPALQALIDGKRIWDQQRGEVMDGSKRWVLRHKNLYLTQTVDMSQERVKAESGGIYGCHIRYDSPGPAFYLRKS